MMEITLNSYELMQGATAGILRNVASIKEQYNRAFTGREWQVHIEGACGEVAVAKAMGRYWGGSVNTFKAQGDLDSVGWEIRTRAEHSYDLIIRDDDQDDRVFVLVTGKAPNYVVRGWIKAGDAKREEWRKNYGGHQPAYFVPQSELREMGDLR